MSVGPETVQGRRRYVLYVGPRGAAKFSSLRTLQRELASDDEPLQLWRAGGDNIVAFLDPGEADDEASISPRGAILALAIPGEAESPANEELLLGIADAVVFVDDSRNPGGKESLDALQRLSSQLDAGRSRGIEFHLQSALSPERAAKVFRDQIRRWNPSLYLEEDPQSSALDVFQALRRAFAASVVDEDATESPLRSGDGIALDGWAPPARNRLTRRGLLLVLILIGFLLALLIRLSISG